MLKIENLTKSYRTSAGCAVVGGATRRTAAATHACLDGVELAVPRGAICALMGASGAGKSTLLGCINGVTAPNSGTVTVDGVELTRLRGRVRRNESRKIGTVFQGSALFDAKTVYGNIAFPLKLWTKRLPARELQARVRRAAEMVGISEKLGSYPGTLSGGQKQRVALARAIVTEPKLLLCDEATSALDAAATREILALLKRLRSELGLTILLSTHEQEVARSSCDMVARLENGVITVSAPGP